MMTRRAGVALALVLATTGAGGVAGVASALPTGMSNPVCTTDCTEDGEGFGAGEARVRGWWRNADGESRLRSQGQGQGFGSGNGGSGNGPGSGGSGQGGSGNGLGKQGNGNGTGPGVESGARGNGGPTGEHSDIPPAVEGAEITDEVAAELAYLAEEEKLAGDVYDLAASLYSVRIFDNIGRSEDNHLAEVRVLLDRYDVPDPTAGAAAGNFTDPDLQALYDTLAAQVKVGWDEAVAAGILIEQTDITDLEALLKKADLPADVRAVAESLLAGSQRHLAAFQRQS